ncbi:TNT domain-containing protein [Amycolatopsis sp., V23-08]|uniref:TNT domain-containing protein n=1 Tax=Amycolatopsis heterodermiae TaxID=3110235 RepID=A0ABU5R0W8_9PSEU|nr:TNT domain-containing protein [Amycolatopsis sp., V23-08]MEA5359822.1 TNT domain-containing protein [Amycolatopsis sp., V23-08]
MRYRVEVAERPDGLYAAWGEGTFRAQRSTTDGTVLLSVLPEEEPPDGFDKEHDGRPARVVPASEVSSTFTLRTYCDYDDEVFEVAPGERPELTLRWVRDDAARAAQLGLTDFSATVPAKQVKAIWQARQDFTESPDARPKPGTGDQNALLRAIGRTLLHTVPGGWARVGAQFRQVGDYSEIELRAVGDEDGPVSVSLPAVPRLGGLFAQLRSAMYQPESGTWFQGTFTLDSASQFDFDFDADREPDWRVPPNDGGRPSTAAYELELGTFPRSAKHLPAWLTARAGLPLDLTFRVARAADSHAEGERPVVNRPPVPPDQVRGVLDYLFRAPVAVRRPAPLPDIFGKPGSPPDVPNAFHTDGTWIWPAAVPHYLRKYGVPPEPELVEHARAAGFRPPFVGELVRATAEAEVAGHPRPPQTAADLPDDRALSRVAQGEQVRNLKGAETLELLQHRLAEHGVPAAAYRIGATEVPAEGVWTLRRAENGWEVSRPPADEPVAFGSLGDAARFLLGVLLMQPARPAEESDQPADWPILPMRGEPPLNFYRGKRVIVLPPGTTVVRFGNETGNLVHAEPTRFVETSLAFERERERRLYRVQRAIRVLTGVTAPWGGMPGGAIAYLLPRPLAQHLETGSLSRQ